MKAPKTMEEVRQVEGHFAKPSHLITPPPPEMALPKNTLPEPEDTASLNLGVFKFPLRMRDSFIKKDRCI